MPLRSGGQAPYTSPTAILGLLDGYRNRGLATPFTQEVLVRAGVLETLAPRTMQSLKGLDLIDADGNPTEAMEVLRRVPQDEYKTRLEELIRGVYAEVFQFADPGTDDFSRVQDAFRHFEPVGQRRRMITLFMGLCEAAGIVPENTVQRASRTTTGRTQNGTPKKKSETNKHKTGRAQRQAYEVEGIPAPIRGLLDSLPPEGESWTQKQRDLFVKTFTAVLDFVIPIRKPVPTDE